MSTSQRAVMFCGWGVRQAWCETVWSMSEWIWGALRKNALYKSTYMTYTYTITSHGCLNAQPTSKLYCPFRRTVVTMQIPRLVTARHTCPAKVVVDVADLTLMTTCCPPRVAAAAAATTNSISCCRQAIASTVTGPTASSKEPHYCRITRC